MNVEGNEMNKRNKENTQALRKLLYIKIKFKITEHMTAMSRLRT